MRFAVWAGLAASAAIMLCSATILALRIAYLLRRRHLQRLLPTWRAALSGGILGEFPTIRVAPRDRWHFIKLWCQLHDSVRGEAREALRGFARVMEMPEWAVALAGQKRLRKRLLGICALGRIGEYAGIESLVVSLLSDPDAVVSLTAAQAYARLVPKEALPPILRAASQRSDWPTARLAEMFREVGIEAATAPLLDAISTLRGAARTRLIPLLACLRSIDAAATIQALLQDPADAESLAATLPATRRPEHLPYVREAATHPAWYVRAQACQALGRLGTLEDLALLSKLLGDHEWWVRYRAAEALLDLPTVPRGALRALAVRHDDPYARDMLRMWLDKSGEPA